jgi:hypothetical protein
MVRCLPWKEKVVRSVATAIILFCTVQNAFPQTIAGAQAPKKITLSCNGIYFQDFINQLAGITGLHFIYSSSKIRTNSLVYLTVRDKSVEEVLGLVGDQLRLSFKKQDRHVVIKTLPVVQPSFVARPLQPKQKNVVRPSIEPASLLTLPDSTILTASAKIAGNPAPSFSSDYFKKHLQDLQVYFDSAMLTRIPPQYIRKINLNNNHRGFFISAGFVVNDYSAGTELQAGIRSAYAVFNSGWTKSGQYSSRYGVGSSFLLSRNFSVNPVYTFAAIREKSSESPWKLCAKHHQVKLMVQYSLSRHVAVRFGPSFNYLNAVYTFQRPKPIFETIIIAGTDNPKNVYYRGEYGAQPSRAGAYMIFTPPGSYQTIRSWMGWEASISYKINFFRRP